MVGEGVEYGAQKGAHRGLQVRLNPIVPFSPQLIVLLQGIFCGLIVIVVGMHPIEQGFLCAL